MIASWITLGLLFLQGPSPPSLQAIDEATFHPALGRVSLDLVSSPNLARTTLTSVEGVPTNSVTDLCYDSDGFLLVGTTGGLARYDGMTFEPLLEKDTPGLDGDRVLVLFTDEAGRSWVGTNRAAPSVYENGQFRTVCDRSVVQSVRQVLPASDGSFWLAGNRLARFAGDSARAVVFADALPKARPNAVAEDREGKLWVTSHHGVYAGGIAGFKRVDKRAARWMLTDFSGQVWCQSLDGVLFQPGGDAAASIDLGRSVALLDEYELDGSRRVLATESGMLLIEPRHADGTGLRVKVIEGTTSPLVLANTVHCILSAGTDDLWIGTSLSGLHHLESSHSKLVELPRPDPIRPVGGVHQVAQDKVLVSGGLLNELFLLDSEGNAQLVPMSDPRDFVVQGAATNAHGTWVITTQGLAELTASGLIANPAWRGASELIIAHPSGTIWAEFHGWFRPVVTSDGQSIPPEASLGCRVPAGGIFSACIHGGTIVVAANIALLKLDADESGWTKLSTLDSVKAHHVRSGVDGELWISTYGQGLLRRSPDGQIAQWSEEAGLPNRFLSWIAPLRDDGALWLHSNIGVIRVKTASLDAFNAGSLSAIEAVTFHSPEANGPSGAELAGGLFALPTLEGVTLFDRADIPPVVEPPRVTFRPPLVDGLPLSERSRPVGKANLVFEFTAPIFPRGTDSQFQYRMSGSNGVWQNAKKARNAHFPALGPGTYALEVRARTPKSRWSPSATSAPLVVGRHWYQQPLTWVLLAAATALTVLWFIGLRTRYLKRRNSVLSEEIYHRLEVENQLRSSEERFRQLFHTAPSAIVSWSPSGKFLDRNDRANELFGWAIDEPIDVHPSELFADAIVGRNAFGRVAEDHTDFTFIADASPKNGPARRCRWRFAHSYDANGALNSIIALVVDLTKQDEDAQTLTRLRTSLARAEEAERGRIARELHDDLSQRLAALAMEAHVVDELLSNGAKEKRSVLVSFRSALENITSDVHSLSRKLHPTIVDDLGLMAALRSECARRNEHHSVPIRLTIDEGLESPPRDTALALFRIAQEAMSNATRHSGATGVQVRLSAKGDALTLVVEDNGRGIEDSLLSAGGGVGLNSMRERARLEGGDLLLERRRGGGTRVVASIPHLRDAV